MSSETVIGLINLAAVGLLALLVRHYLSSYLTEKGKNLATKEDIADITSRIEEVRAQYATQLEKVRFELARAGNVHRFQYETELKTYEAIWNILVEVQDAVQSLRPILDTRLSDKADQDKRDQERLRSFGEAFNKFRGIVHKRRPFFPRQIFSELEALMKLAHGEALEVAYKEEGWSKEYWQSARKNAEAISTQVDSICEAIRTRLRDTGVA